MPSLTVTGPVAVLDVLVALLDRTPSADFGWVQRSVTGRKSPSPNRWEWVGEGGPKRKVRYSKTRPGTGRKPTIRAAHPARETPEELLEELISRGPADMAEGDLHALAESLATEYTRDELRALGKKMGWKAGAKIKDQLALDIVEQARKYVESTPLLRAGKSANLADLPPSALTASPVALTKSDYSEDLMSWRKTAALHGQPLTAEDEEYMVDRASVLAREHGKAIPDAEEFGMAYRERRRKGQDDLAPATSPTPAPDQPGFTGTITDSLGRKVTYVDGQRVAAPEEEESNGRSADGRSDTDMGGTDGGGAGGPPVPTTGRIVTAREPFTRSADPGVVPAGLREHLNDHQVQGVATALTALDEHGGFLLADGTGVGKTRQELAVAAAAAAAGKKVLIVTRSEVIKPDWKKGQVTGSFAADSEAMGVPIHLNGGDAALVAGQVHVSTYERLGDLKGMVDGDTLVIFDESHALKNWGSARGKHGYEMSKAAGQVMYATATPADKPLHIAHLFRAGVFGDRKWEDTYRDLGMRQVSVHTPNGTIQKWEVDPRVGMAEVYRRMSGLFDQMTAEGLMLKREISFAGVDVGFRRIELPPEAHEAMARIEDVLSSGKDVQAKISDAYDRLGRLRSAQRDVASDLRGIAQGDAGYSPSMRESAQNRHQELAAQIVSTQTEIDRLKASSRTRNAGLERAQILMHQRRQQETFKVPAAVEAALAELGEGRQVVLFASRVSESGVGEKGAGGIHSEGTAGLLRKALEEAGVPASDIADLHGGVTPKKRKEAVEAFQASKARVIIATVESGGTGINLDDTAGNRPRSMIMLTAPFSAVENVQAAGRVWRLKTQSSPRLRYLFGDTEVDDWNASLIAGKMKVLGATVGGQVEYLDVPDLDVSPDEEAERMAASKSAATSPTPFAWPHRLMRPKSEREPVRLTGSTYGHRDRIKAAGGHFEDGAWVLPKYAADKLRGLPGVRFSDTPSSPGPATPPIPAPAPAPAPARPQVATRLVKTSRGERHVYGFAPTRGFWDARNSGRLPSSVSVRKNDRTGEWEASIWGDTPDQVAETYAALKNMGLIARSL